jgi:acetylornithine deacetylase
MLETTRLLRDLVRRPSVNPMGRDLRGPEIYEHQVTAYLDDFFRGLGVHYERQTVAPLRDNIVARYEPPGATWTLVLEAHQDTVPADGMTVEPFAARVEGDRMYGRGACDIKGGMAAMLAAFARLVREKPAGAGRVVLACTVDEESTFLGVQRLVKDDLRGSCRGPIGAVVAEPTGLNIVDAHKGVVRWDLVTTGRSCHSSRPEQGVNAIYRMAAVLPLVERFAEELRSVHTHPRLGPATLSVGRIEGGVSVNTVPDRCRVEIDRRLLPGEDPAAAPDELAAYLRRHTDVPFECSRPWLSCPSLSPDGSAWVTARLGKAIDAVTGRHEVHAVPYGTDASSLALAGVPAVVFGPGNIARAHTCDEWVSLDEVGQAAEVLFLLATGAE